MLYLLSPLFHNDKNTTKMSIIDSNDDLHSITHSSIILKPIKFTPISKVPIRTVSSNSNGKVPSTVDKTKNEQFITIETEERRKEILKPYGMDRSGHNCYKVTFFQALFSIPKFVKFFVLNKFDETKQELCSIIKKFITDEYQKGNRNLNCITNYIHKSPYFTDEKFQDGKQCDIAELFEYILIALDNEIDGPEVPLGNTDETALKVSKSRRIHRWFNILEKTSTTHFCRIEDDNKSKKITSYQEKCLFYLRNKSDIQKEFDEYATFEIFNIQDEMFCKGKDFDGSDQCQNHESHYFNEKTDIINLPTCLFVQNALYWQDDLYNKGSLFKRISSKIPVSEQIYLNNIKYRLSSIIFRSGNLIDGHYYLITKRDGKWYFIDGVDVQEEKLETDYQNVYLLVYIKDN